MLVHRGERVIVEFPGDFLEAGCVPVVLGVAAEEVEYLALPLGERHARWGTKVSLLVRSIVLSSCRRLRPRAFAHVHACAPNGRRKAG